MITVRVLLYLSDKFMCYYIYLAQFECYYIYLSSATTFICPVLLHLSGHSNRDKFNLSGTVNLSTHIKHPQHSNTVAMCATTFI